MKAGLPSQEYLSYTFKFQVLSRGLGVVDCAPARAGWKIFFAMIVDAKLSLRFDISLSGLNYKQVG